MGEGCSDLGQRAQDLDSGDLAQGGKWMYISGTFWKLKSLSMKRMILWYDSTTVPLSAYILLHPGTAG